MMVTGDHYLTATAVAQATGMLNFKRSHILITQPEVVQCYKGTAKVDAPPFSEKPTSSRLISRQDNLLSAAFTAFRIPAEPGRRAGVANSRSQSLGKLDARRTEMLLSDVSGAGLSTTHIFPKPVLQSRSSGQSAQPAIATSHLFTQMRSKEANLQEKRSAGAGVFASHMVRARSSEPYLLHQLTTQADSDALCHLQPLAAAEADARQEKLQFILVEEGRFTQLLPGQAFAMIAEGRQCIITGPVLDHLIQEAELASLEAVLQNVVVCARMRSNHKAQLLHLLSDGGLTVSSNRVLQVQLAPIYLSNIFPLSHGSAYACHAVLDLTGMFMRSPTCSNSVPLHTSCHACINQSAGFEGLLSLWIRALGMLSVIVVMA